MDAPAVSYCLATYKRPEFLRKTLASILAQTGGNLEVVVSDNDPEGSAQAVVAECNDGRIRYARNERNVGMVRNFNNALAHATGRYVVFITDDDPIVPDHLQTLLQLQRDHPGHTAYYGMGTVCTTDARLARLYNQPLGLKPRKETGAVTVYGAEDFVKGIFSGISGYLLWSCGMVEANVAKRFGMPDYGTPYLTDFAYVALTGGVGGCVIKDKVLGWQTVHAGNFGRSDFHDIAVAAEAVQRLIKDQWPGNAGIGSAVDKFLKGWCAGHLVFLFRYCGDIARRREIFRVLDEIARRCGIAGMRARFFRRLIRAYFRDVRALLRLRRAP